MQPLLSQLRPMNVGDILDQAFSLYRKNFVTLVGIIAIINVPLLILQVIASLFALPVDPLFQGRTSAQPDPTPFFVIFFSTTIITLIIGGIASIFQIAALSVVVSERYLGHDITIRQAYRQALRHWRALVAAILIVGAAYLGLLIFFLVPCVGWLVAPLVFVICSTRWMFSWQAIVLENLGSADALRRSWRLVEGITTRTFWRVSAITFVLSFMIGIVSSGPTYLVLFLTALLPSFVIATVLNSILTSAISIVLMPIQFAALTLLYYDLRVRAEGYDLAVRVSQLAEQVA